MVQTEAGTKESLTALEDGGGERERQTYRQTDRVYEREREREREKECVCVCVCMCVCMSERMRERKRERDFFLGLSGNTVRNHTGPQG